MLLVRSAAVLANRVRLPRLVKRLEVERPRTALHALAHAVPEERLGALQAGHSSLVRRALRRPARLADPELDLLAAAAPRGRLDVRERLRDVVVEDGDGAVDGRALPVGEGVDEEDVDGRQEGVCRAVGVLVPRVRGAVAEVRGRAAEVVDLGDELVGRVGLAVEGLGADGDGVDLVFVVDGRVDDGRLGGVVRRVVLGPETPNSLATTIIAACLSCRLKGEGALAYHTPRMTWNPLFFAAGRICRTTSQSAAE